MEYASGGTLFDRVLRFQKFKEDIARYFFQQLVCGVSWCHSKVGSAAGAAGAPAQQLHAGGGWSAARRLRLWMRLPGRPFLATTPHSLTAAGTGGGSFLACLV